MQLQHEQGAGVGPYGNEGGMAQGHLAAIPNEQLDAQGGKDGKSNHIGYGEEVTTGILRDDVKNTEKKENHLSPHELRLPPGMFLPVILMVNPAGAMAHKSSFYQYSPINIHRRERRDRREKNIHSKGKRTLKTIKKYSISLDFEKLCGPTVGAKGPEPLGHYSLLITIVSLSAFSAVSAVNRS
jgi:hypothetical protein